MRCADEGAGVACKRRMMLQPISVGAADLRNIMEDMFVAAAATVVQ